MHQRVLLEEQLVATRQQLQQLLESYQELANRHKILSQQVVRLQKYVKNQDAVIRRTIESLESVDMQNGNSRSATEFRHDVSGMDPTIQNEEPQTDHPASLLQQATRLLQNFSAENLQIRGLGHISQSPSVQDSPDTTLASTDNISQTGQGSENTGANIQCILTNDFDNTIYPAGQTNGTGTFKGKHTGNAPYTVPPNGVKPAQKLQEMLSKSSSNKPKKASTDTIWGCTKPRILLVEDDRICASIGSKFLRSFECDVDIAVGFASAALYMTAQLT